MSLQVYNRNERGALKPVARNSSRHRFGVFRQLYGQIQVVFAYAMKTRLRLTYSWHSFYPHTYIPQLTFVDCNIAVMLKLRDCNKYLKPLLHKDLDSWQYSSFFLLTATSTLASGGDDRRESLGINSKFKVWWSRQLCHSNWRYS